MSLRSLIVSDRVNHTRCTRRINALRAEVWIMPERAVTNVWTKSVGFAKKRSLQHMP